MRPAFVRGERVLLPDGTRPATIHIQNGRIVRVGPYEDSRASTEGINAGSLLILPGLVDPHVHINEPGRTDWEGFSSATRAAAAGGVTTLVEMPLNSRPATVDVEALDAKLSATDRQLHVDVGFWGGIVPDNASAIRPLADRGVLGFKSFLAPSGVEEFPHVCEEDLRDALPILAPTGLPLLVHAELPALLRDADPAGDPRTHRTWLHTRPVESEVAAVDLMIGLARESGARVHIVHLSSAASLVAIRRARESGVAISCETCPHYLTFDDSRIPDGETTFKCAPPIRDAAERENLWRALAAGAIDLVATDHSPAPPALKHLDDGDFLRAWGGIASLQLGLSVVWTGASARNLPVDLLPRWMAEEPAKLAGLQGSKGAIAAGLDADLVLWDPDAEQIVDPAALQHRHPITPYAGMRLRGRVRTTILRGQVVFDDGVFAGPPRGHVILRPRSRQPHSRQS
jgi:allantoinase